MLNEIFSVIFKHCELAAFLCFASFFLYTSFQLSIAFSDTLGMQNQSGNHFHYNKTVNFTKKVN